MKVSHNKFLLLLASTVLVCAGAESFAETHAAKKDPTSQQLQQMMMGMMGNNNGNQNGGGQNGGGGSDNRKNADESKKLGAEAIKSMNEAAKGTIDAIGKMGQQAGEMIMKSYAASVSENSSRLDKLFAEISQRRSSSSPENVSSLLKDIEGSFRTTAEYTLSALKTIQENTFKNTPAPPVAQKRQTVGEQLRSYTGGGLQPLAGSGRVGSTPIELAASAKSPRTQLPPLEGGAGWQQGTSTSTNRPKAVLR